MLPQLLGVRQLWLCAQPSSEDCVVAKGMVVVSGTGAPAARSVTVTDTDWLPSACVSTLLSSYP